MILDLIYKGVEGIWPPSIEEEAFGAVGCAGLDAGGRASCGFAEVDSVRRLRSSSTRSDEFSAMRIRETVDSMPIRAKTTEMMKKAGETINERGKRRKSRTKEKRPMTTTAKP